MRIALLFALFLSFSYSGLIQKSDFKKYETLVNSITFNQKNNVELIENTPREQLIRPGIDEEPLLYIAAKYRKEEVFKKLLEREMNPNVIFRGTTLIHYVLNSRPTFLRFLNIEEINFLTPDRDGNIPLNMITERYNLKILSMFLKRIDNSTPNLETKNSEGLTFLHLLIQNGNEEALRTISQKYKLKAETPELLRFAFKKDIKMFNHLLNMVEDDRNFFIKNPENILAFLLKTYSESKTSTIRKRSIEAIESIYKHLKKKKKLEFLYSLNEEGKSFIDMAIEIGDDTLVNLFYSDRQKIPLGYGTIITAINHQFDNPNIFHIIKQYSEDKTVFHDILKDSQTTANSIKYLPLFDYKNLNTLDKTNKKHFLNVAIEEKRWDFIYNLLTLEIPELEINNQYIVKMLEANILLAKKLILSTHSNAKIFNKTFLFYLINSSHIKTKDKEEIIWNFIERHVRTKKQLDSYFFENTKMDINISDLLKLKIPGARIIDHIEELKNKPEEEPFMTIYKGEKIDDFYNNSLTKTNRFGTSAINAAINDDYTHLHSMLEMFKNNEPAERYREVLDFTREHKPALYPEVSKILGMVPEGGDTRNAEAERNLRETKGSILLSILNNEKVVIKKTEIGFENFIKPMFLYNQDMYAKIPNSMLKPFSTELTELFIKTNRPIELVTFLNRNKIKLEGRKLGGLAVQYSFSDLEELVERGIDLDFNLKNNYTYFDNLILNRNIDKMGRLLKNGKHEITGSGLFETKHVLEALFAFDDINVLLNIKKKKNSKYSTTFFVEKYKYFIENNKFKEFQFYLENGLFEHNDLDIYKEMFSKTEDKTGFFEMMYRNNLDFDTKQNIVESALSSLRLEVLNRVNEGELRTILDSDNFLQPILRRMSIERLPELIDYLVRKGHDFKMPTISYLYSIENYSLIQKVYENMTPRGNAMIREELMNFISSLKENQENMDLFMYIYGKFYRDYKVTKETLISSIENKGRFIYFIKKSDLKVGDYQEIFGHLLSKNPKHTMFKTILEHPVGTNISFNTYFQKKHLLEIMLEKNLDEMFTLTLAKIQDKADREVTKKIILKLLELKKLDVYDRNIARINDLISKHKVSIIPLIMEKEFNLPFTAYALNNNTNIQLPANGEHPIFSIFRKRDISNVDKIKFFYVYKDKKINILEKDQNGKSLFHYLVDFSIKERNLSNMISKIPEEIRLRYLEKSNLFNYIVETGNKYNGIIKRNLTTHKISLSNTSVPLPLKVIEHKERDLFDFLLESGMVEDDMEDDSGKTILRYAIETKEIYYLDKLASIGVDVSAEDVTFAREIDCDADIISFLQDKSTFIYKIQKIFSSATKSPITLGGAIIMLIGFGAFTLRKREMDKKRALAESKRKGGAELSPEEIKLQELKERVAQLSGKNDEEELDEELVRSIEEEFEELNRNKPNSIFDLGGRDTESPREKKSFSQEELASRLEEINNNLEEFEIPDDILKELEEDFAAGEDDEEGKNNETDK